MTTWGVEGRAWSDMPRQRWFDRFPAAAERTVTPAVWELSRDSTGMMARFKTDATTIWVHYLLRSASLALPHMPATGVSGVDLYAHNGQGKWRWVNVTRPGQKEVREAIASGLAPGMREYAAYLPLYNGVESFEIGVPPGAIFAGLAPRPDKPLVFYGTSITQGACASRPGMVYTAILGRHFDRPVVNIGFSGNGRMDAAVGAVLAKIDAAAYVIDCSANTPVADVPRKCPAAGEHAPRGAAANADRAGRGSPHHQLLDPARPAKEPHPESRRALRVFRGLAESGGGQAVLHFRRRDARRRRRGAPPTAPIPATWASCGRRTPSSRCCARPCGPKAAGSAKRSPASGRNGVLRSAAERCGSLGNQKR